MLLLVLAGASPLLRTQVPGVNLRAMQDVPDRAQCAARDQADPLRLLRDEFLLPPDTIYLDGNSLGALPRRVKQRMKHVVAEEWGQGLIRGWNEAGWIDLPQKVGAKIAPLIGARPGEVIAADSTTINLLKLVLAAARLKPDSKVILTESGNFPTDLYAAESAAELQGRQVRRVDAGAIAGAIDKHTACVVLTHVDYRSGRMHDMGGITRAAHAAGALMLWDLAHSAGAVPVDLNGAGADLAVGCGYKYLNGGPGAPAFLYARRDLQAELQPVLAGWMGHARPFDFAPAFAPGPGMTRHLIGTPAILSLSALDAALDLWADVDMKTVRAKSVALAELFIALVEARCAGFGLALASPRAAGERGSQVTWRHADAFEIMRAVIARGVIGDFRGPDLMRFGLAPLYVRFADIFDAVEILRGILASGAWDQPSFRQRAKVT